jgi:hypothetical protein
MTDMAGSEPHQAAGGKAAETRHLLAHLLADIRAAFGQAEHLSSAELVASLVAKGRPWAALGRNRKPLTPTTLARLLRPLAIAPERIGPKTKRRRGYTLAQFEELPGGSHPLTRLPCDGLGTSEKSQASTANPGWPAGKCKKPSNDGTMDECTGAERVCAHCHHPETPGDPVEEVTLLLHRHCQRSLGAAPAPARVSAAAPPADQPVNWAPAPAGAGCLLCCRDGDVFLVDLGDGHPSPLHRACARIIKADLEDEEVAVWWRSVRP